MTSSRPASDSLDWRSSAGDALPSSRKRAGLSGRSISTRSTLNSSGACWTSSMTTRPRRSFSATIGAASWASTCGSSRSNQLGEPGASSVRASVVLPTCRGPTSGHGRAAPKCGAHGRFEGETFEHGACYLENPACAAGISRYQPTRAGTPGSVPQPSGPTCPRAACLDDRAGDGQARRGDDRRLDAHQTSAERRRRVVPRLYSAGRGVRGQSRRDEHATPAAAGAEAVYVVK